VKLHHLVPDGHVLVTEALARGDLDRHPPEVYAELLDECHPALDLDDLDRALDQVIAETPRHDPVIEQRAAAVVHRALPLSRRAAAQPGLWRFLAVIHRPDFVRHRWAFEAWSTTRSRYWTPGVRHDSNVFARLWWIAELTRDGDDYRLTAEVFARQTLAIQLFVRRFAWHRPALAAAVAVLADAAPREIELVARDLAGALATRVVELLDEAALRDLLAALLAEVRARG